MPEISFKDQIKRIVDLQKIDGEIHQLKVTLQEKPATLEQLKDQFEALKGRLVELEEKTKAIQVGRKEKELELKSKEEEIAKANAQLSQIKTNKEYTAKISEIEHIKADCAVVEEKILVSYDESDLVSGEIENEKEEVAREEKSYLLKKKETEDDVKVIEDRVKVLESQRQQGTDGISVEYLSRYEKLLKHKEGLAIVPVVNNSCGGCFMNVTQQKVNTIKMSDQLVECEICSRILYLEDNL